MSWMVSGDFPTRACMVRDVSTIDVLSFPLRKNNSACMWMASKMEEVISPSVEDFVYISADSYTKQDITEMELAVCDTLQFRLYQVTPHHFVEEFLRDRKSVV